MRSAGYCCNTNLSVWSNRSHPMRSAGCCSNTGLSGQLDCSHPMRSAGCRCKTVLSGQADYSDSMRSAGCRCTPGLPAQASRSESMRSAGSHRNTGLSAQASRSESMRQLQCCSNTGLAASLSLITPMNLNYYRSIVTWSDILSGRSSLKRSVGYRCIANAPVWSNLSNPMIPLGYWHIPAKSDWSIRSHSMIAIYNLCTQDLTDSSNETAPKRSIQFHPYTEW